MTATAEEILRDELLRVDDELVQLQARITERQGRRGRVGRALDALTDLAADVQIAPDPPPAATEARDHPDEAARAEESATGEGHSRG